MGQAWKRSRQKPGAGPGPASAPSFHLPTSIAHSLSGPSCLSPRCHLPLHPPPAFTQPQLLTLQLRCCKSELLQKSEHDLWSTQQSNFLQACRLDDLITCIHRSRYHLPVLSKAPTPYFNGVLPLPLLSPRSYQLSSFKPSDFVLPGASSAGLSTFLTAYPIRH